jgi:hypothetical protein
MRARIYERDRKYGLRLAQAIVAAEAINPEPSKSLERHFILILCIGIVGWGRIPILSVALSFILSQFSILIVALSRILWIDAVGPSARPDAGPLLSPGLGQAPTTIYVGEMSE